jgi:FixJ family two-component response regulator/GAF domain-containing protein
MNTSEDKRKILVIDDEQALCVNLQMLLQSKLNVEVDYAVRAEPAFELLKQHDYDVIILDYNIPQLTGLDILSKLRADNITSQVIMLTGYGTLPVAVDAFKLDLFDFMGKPYNSAQLVNTVKQAIEKHRLLNAEKTWQTFLTTYNEELESKNKQLQDTVTKYHDSVHFLHRLESLVKIFNKLGDFSTLNPLLAFIIESVTNLIGADRSTLFLADHENNELFSEIAEGMEGKEIRFPIGIGIAGSVAADKKTVLIPDAYADDRFNPAFDKTTGYKTRNILCMSMCNLEGKVIGVIQVLNKNKGDFTDEDVTLLSAFCTHAAVNLESTILFEQMENLVEKRTEQLQVALNNNRNILENIDSGILVLSPDMTIKPEYSKSCERIYESKELAGKLYFDLGFQPFVPGDGAVAQMKDWFQYGFDNPDMEQWEELSTEQKLYLNNKLLKISFQRIFSKDTVSSIMIITEDYTEQYKLEQELERKSQEAETQVKNTMVLINAGRHDSEVCIATINEGLDTAKANLSNLSSHDCVNEIFRQYHSMKGLCQTFGFDDMASSLHKEEDQWMLYRQSKSLPDKNELVSRVNALESLFKDLDNINNLRSTIYDSKGEHHTIQIPQEEILTLLNKHENKSKEDFYYFLLGFKDHSFPYISRHLESEARFYAKKLNKEIIWDTPKHTVSICPKVWSHLQVPFGHLIRNTLDHGIEEPDLRKANNKPPKGLINFDYTKTDKEMIFILEDDGKGIDLQHLKKLGLKKQMIDETKDYSDEEIMDLIFQPGFSTRNQVSEVSGRGVGMDAVKQTIVKQLNGKISIQSKLREGTKITINIPIE